MKAKRLSQITGIILILVTAFSLTLQAWKYNRFLDDKFCENKFFTYGKLNERHFVNIRIGDIEPNTLGKIEGHYIRRIKADLMVQGLTIGWGEAGHISEKHEVYLTKQGHSVGVFFD